MGKTIRSFMSNKSHHDKKSNKKGELHCREHKLRNTRQQRIIRDILQTAQRPLNAEEVFQIARGTYSKLGIATVYRTLRRMTEAGVIAPVAIAGEGAYYEMSKPGHHHYFHCCYCRKVYVIEGCPGVIEQLTPMGFRHERHEIVLHGFCSDCNGK